MFVSPLVTEPGVESSATRQTCIRVQVSLEFWICAASWGLYSETGSGINMPTQFGPLEDASSIDCTSMKCFTVRDGNKCSFRNFVYEETEDGGQCPKSVILL